MSDVKEDYTIHKNSDDNEIPVKRVKLDDTTSLTNSLTSEKTKRRCVFRVIRKGRNCNQLVKNEAKYCVEHSYMDKVIIILILFTIHKY